MALKPEIAKEVKGVLTAVAAVFLWKPCTCLDGADQSSAKTSVDAAEALIEELDRRGHLDMIGSEFKGR